MMRRMWEGPAPRPARRALLLGGAALPLLAAGCGVRLEEDAPPVPLVPTRTPLPAEDLLVPLTRECRTLADVAARTSGAVAAALVPLHHRQHTVLRTTLIRLGVPTEVVDGTGTTADDSPTPSPTASAASPTTTTSEPTTPTTTSTASPTATGPTEPPADLARAEGDSATRAATFSGADGDLHPTLAALHAQRFAAAVLLGEDEPVAPGDPVEDASVEELAAQTRGAVYFLEVVAARTSGATAKRARATLGRLEDLVAEQVAGGPGPTAALGHPLPFEVRSPDDATRLARESLGTLRAGYGPRLDPLLRAGGDAGWTAASRWLGTVEAECHRWGLALQPFPSLS